MHGVEFWALWLKLSHLGVGGVVRDYTHALQNLASQY